MCGIVGFAGKEDCTDILVKALRRLEYRGYDSAGIAVFDGNDITTVKAKGKICPESDSEKNTGLMHKLETEGKPHGFCGIGHTRWATHGAPSDKNSHPMRCGNVCIVHNGIIENYRELKEFLADKGCEFESDTDTEVAAMLLDYYYEGDPLLTISKVLDKIEGAYALGIIFRDRKDTIYCTKKECPLIVGRGIGKNFIASDVTAILEYTKDYHLLEYGEIAEVTADCIKFYDSDVTQISKELFTANWDLEAAEKSGYEHFMLKEIHEQPNAVKRTLSPRITDNMPDFEECGLTDEKINSYDRIHIVGCGSAMHAGMVAKYVIEELARVPVLVDIASEFRYRNPLVTDRDLVIIISQSGETADTLAALKLSNEIGADTLAIVNVVGSSIARESKMVMYTNAGPEISVCSTKAYAVQIALMYLLAFRIAYAKKAIDEEKCRLLTGEISEIHETIRHCIEKKEQYQLVASNIMNADSLLYIGRGLDYAMSMEGSLKLKEISYIHSESYAAGELKHGTISLVDPYLPVIAVATQKNLVEKMQSNIAEVHARGAKVIVITREDIPIDDNTVDCKVILPAVSDILMPMVTVVPLQMIAYYTAVQRGTNVDKPRNLAKSVTTE